MTPKNPGPKKVSPILSQLRRAAIEVATLDRPGRAFERLAAIVGEAQNPPPDGRADGSIDERTWIVLMQLVQAAREYDRALTDAVDQLRPAFTSC